MKLDYTLQTAEERLQLVNQILEENPNPNEKYLEILADYLIIGFDKDKKRLVTPNREQTIAKRETSWEGLADQFEQGEDSINNLIRNDKNILFRPRETITDKDVAEIPFLAQIRETISNWEQYMRKAGGRSAYLAKTALIETRKEQYSVKNAYRKPVIAIAPIHSKKPFYLDAEEELINGDLVYNAASFCNKDLILNILCNYSQLREAGKGDFNSDVWFLMESFDELCGRALEKDSFYEKVMRYKIEGKTNAEINALLGNQHTDEFFSVVWRKKIPKIIADRAIAENLIWLWSKNSELPWKKCGRCGQEKPAHPYFFNRNQNNFYSICKECRKKKK